MKMSLSAAVLSATLLASSCDRVSKPVHEAVPAATNADILARLEKLEKENASLKQQLSQAQKTETEVPKDTQKKSNDIREIQLDSVELTDLLESWIQRYAKNEGKVDSFIAPSVQISDSIVQIWYMNTDYKIHEGSDNFMFAKVDEYKDNGAGTYVYSGSRFIPSNTYHSPSNLASIKRREEGGNNKILHDLDRTVRTDSDFLGNKLVTAFGTFEKRSAK